MLGVLEQPNSQETLYDVLGIPETASSEEVKRAYYRLIRRTPAHRNPELFQKLNEAGSTLIDARRRAEYDQRRRSGTRIQTLLDQAAVALERDNQKAIALLKGAIAQAPDMTRPRHLLAHVLMKVEEYALAEKQYRWLLRESPRDETLHFKLARCLYLQERLPEAQKSLQNALQLNPCYHDALMLASRIHEDTAEFEAARNTLERAILNDAKENFADFDALLRLYILNLLVDSSLEHEEVVCRLLRVLPSGGTENQAEKIHRAAKKMLSRAREFYRSNNYAVANGILRVAGKLSPVEEDTASSIRNLTQLTTLTLEAQHTETDALLTPALKKLFQLFYRDRSTDSQRNSQINATIAEIHTEIGKDPKLVGTAIEYVRREYPGIGEEQNALLEDLQQRVHKRLLALEGSIPQIMPGVTAAAPEEPEEKPRKGLFGIFRNKR
jgi:curved DNA-binding protein CbpA